MRQEHLFQKLEYPYVIYKGHGSYVSPKHNYYYLDENSEYITIMIMNESKKKPDERLRIYKIWKEDDLEECLVNSINHYEEMGDELFIASNIFPLMALFVRDTMHKEIGEEELRNLCALYDAGVRAGGLGFMITDACREVLELLLMEPDEYVDPELHEQLKNIPDMYYQFLLKVEMNVAENPIKQERLKKYMQKYQLRNTSEVILYVSYLTENIDYPDETINKLVNLYRTNETFQVEQVSDHDEEKTVEKNNHEWKLVSLIINDRGYRIRHCGPIFFLDYEDSAVADCALLKAADDMAQIVHLSISDELLYPGAKERMIRYAERMALGAGLHRMIINCREEAELFFMKQGYARMAEEEPTFSRGIAMKKILK